MKVYFSVHNWLPSRYEGATVYHHNLALLMLSWGWEVRACADIVKEPYEFEGVQVLPFKDHPAMVKWCDIAIAKPMQMNRCKGKPTFVIKHNMSREPVNSFSGKHVIFCADHVRKLGTYGAKSTVVFWPPNRFLNTELRGNRNGYATLVNCNPNKGGNYLIKLAKMMPDTMFLGVLGAYDKQITEVLPNLQYLPSTNDMASIYQQTAILLVLSQKEGLPTVVLEAQSFGIPVVGFDIPALREVGDVDICRNLTEVAEGIRTALTYNDHWVPINKHQETSQLKEFFEHAITRPVSY